MVPGAEEQQARARELGEAIEQQGGSPEVAREAVERVATALRHRNEDMVPGRIVHAVFYDHRRLMNRCLAAIIVDVDPNRPGVADLRLFPPSDQDGLLGLPAHGPWSRGDTGEAATWHFSIDCATVLARRKDPAWSSRTF